MGFWGKIASPFKKFFQFFFGGGKLEKILTAIAIDIVRLLADQKIPSTEKFQAAIALLRARARERGIGLIDRVLRRLIEKSYTIYENGSVGVEMLDVILADGISLARTVIIAVDSEVVANIVEPGDDDRRRAAVRKLKQAAMKANKKWWNDQSILLVLIEYAVAEKQGDIPKIETSTA